MALTQEQIDALKYNLRQQYLRIELLDINLKTIDSIEAVAISGSITGNADNDIRYTGNITLAIPTYYNTNNFLETVDGYTISVGGKIWLDKKVKIFIGILDIQSNETVWYPLGIYYINQPVRNFSATDYTISFDIADQMLGLSGARQGQLTGTTTVFEVGYTETQYPAITTGLEVGSSTITFNTSYSGNFSDYNVGNVFSTENGNTININSEINTSSKVLYSTYSPSNNINNIAYGNGIWVGVTSTYPTGDIYYSTNDGETWTLCTNTWNMPLGDVCYGNGIFVAIPTSGIYETFLYSTDGITWIETDPISPKYWQQIIYKNSKFIAIGSNNSGISYSEDGIIWQTFYISSSRIFYNITANDNIYIATGSSNYFAYSVNLQNWYFLDVGTSDVLNDWIVSYGNGIFVAINRDVNIELTSEDGLNWIRRLGPFAYYSWGSSTATHYCRAIRFGEGTFIAISQALAATTGNAVMYSNDGVNWDFKYCTIQVNNSGLADYTAINWGNNYFLYLFTTTSYIGRLYPQINLNYDDTVIGYYLNGLNTWNESSITIDSDSGPITTIDSTLLSTFSDYATLSQQVYVKTRTEDALKSVITELGGITNYSIYPIPTKYEYLPYEIKVTTGATVLDIINKFMNILSTWQKYFDRETGTFIIEPIPSGLNDTVYEIDDIQIIQNQQSQDFENVKNQIVVYGRLNTLTYYTDEDAITGAVSYSGNTLNLNYEAITSTSCTIGGTLFGFLTPYEYNPELTQVNIYVNSVLLVSGSLVDFEYSNSSISAGYLQPNEIYCIRIYDATLNSDNQINFDAPVVFEFYSKQQVSWCLVNDNIESPYYINGNITSPNFYGGLTTSTNGTNYTLTLNNATTLSSLEDKTIITFMVNLTNTADCDFTIYSALDSSTPILSSIPLKQNVWNSDGITRPNLIASKMGRDYTIFKMQYDATNGWFVFLGRNDKVLTKILSGGEYDNIYADELALERCKYELFQYSNLQNNITLSTRNNFILDVNKRIPYRENFAVPQENTLLNFNVKSDTILGTYEQFVTSDNETFMVQDSELTYYIVKTITFPLGIDNTNQSITAIEIYDNKNLVGDDYSYSSGITPTTILGIGTFDDEINFAINNNDNSRLDVISAAIATDVTIDRNTTSISSLNGVIFMKGSWSIGDIATSALTTEEQITYQIIGFKSDYATVDNIATDGTFICTDEQSNDWYGHNVRGITISSKQCLTSFNNINDSDTNLGGWSSCSLRTAMATYLLEIPIGLRNSIKTVGKLSANGGGTNYTAIISSTDTLWIPSLIEIMGTTRNNTDTGYDPLSFGGEGLQYSFYKNASIPSGFTPLGGSSGTFIGNGNTYYNLLREQKLAVSNFYYNVNNSKAKGYISTPFGIAVSWWTRSSTLNNEYTFDVIWNGGESSIASYNDNFGVVLCFSI